MFEMTKNVLRNLAGKYSTRLYPFVIREPYQGFRGRLEQNIDECIFCRACEKRCPSLCITLDTKNYTWSCDPFACVYCGLCVDVCPTHCLSMANIHRSAVGERESMFYQGKPPKKKAKAEKAAE